jgi:hypothetical protein
MRPYIRVQHIDHAEGQIVGTFNPLEPRFAYRANDVGDLTYKLALSNQQVTRDAFAPKRTDFRLQVSYDGAFWTNIMGGFHWPVGINNEEGTVSVQGMDWMAWLEQPMWFDAYLIDAMDLIAGKTKIQGILDDAESWGRAWTSEPGTDTEAIKYNADQRTVVTDLIDSIADGNDGTININTTFSGDGTGWDLKDFSYVVMFQDDTTILDHIRAISDMDDPYGFDFFMNWDKTLVCYNPARTAPISSIVPIYEITRSSPGLVALQWQNSGPMATHTVGVGPGSPGIWAQKTFAPSVDAYRRWLRLVKLGGSYRRPEQIKAAVNGIPDRFPQKDLKLTLKPDLLEPLDPTAFFHPMIGEALYVDIDFPRYHRINANFWITAQEFHTDDEGNWLCDVSLQQIYDPSGIG